MNTSTLTPEIRRRLELLTQVHRRRAGPKPPPPLPDGPVALREILVVLMARILEQREDS